jgi:hypothetical protein
MKCLVIILRQDSLLPHTMSLDLRILCNRPEAQQFIIFVNPSELSDGGQLFTNLYPIAWKVLKFAGTSRANKEIPLVFRQERTVGIAAIEKDKEVTAAWSESIGVQKKNNFLTKDDEGAYKLVLNSNNPDVKLTAKVVNMERTRINIFFGDKDGNPFMYQEATPGEAVNFNENTEIVIAAVRGYKESQVIESDITGSWMRFKVKDTQNQHENKLYVEYKYSGQYERYGGTTAPFEQFGPEIPIFPSTLGSKTMEALSNPRTMEVEIYSAVDAPI